MSSPPRSVVLAAGASRRLGQPKALVELPRGRPVVRLVRAAVRAASLAGRPELPLVVTGAHDAEIRAVLSDELGEELSQAQLEALVRHNPHWEAGRTGGLSLAQAESPGRDLCVLPVDHPRISAELLLALFAAWRRRGAPARGWLAPGFHGSGSAAPPAAELRPGHPVLLGSELAAELAGFGPDQPLKRLRLQADPLWMLPTDEVAVLENLDRPEDLVRLLALDRP